VPIADFTTYGQWFWNQITTSVGNPSHFRNPGDGFGNGCTDWGERLADCGVGSVSEQSLMVMFDELEQDCEFVANEVSCIANVNVTLNEFCMARITPSMVLAGVGVDCAENISITVDDTNSDVLSGCGDHTYMATVTDVTGNVTYTCWGNIFAEDKTDPVVECPDDTDEVTVDFDLQTLEGSIDGTEDEITLSDYSCFQSFFEPAPDFVYNYDLITFTVDPDLPQTDVYNI